MDQLWQIKQAIEDAIDLLKQASRIAIDESGADETCDGWPALSALADTIDAVTGQAEKLLPLHPEIEHAIQQQDDWNADHEETRY